MQCSSQTLNPAWIPGSSTHSKSIEPSHVWGYTVALTSVGVRARSWWGVLSQSPVLSMSLKFSFPPSMMLASFGLRNWNLDLKQTCMDSSRPLQTNTSCMAVGSSKQILHGFRAAAPNKHVRILIGSSNQRDRDRERDMYVYIYIQRERSMYIYIYTGHLYIYTHRCICIYRARERQTQGIYIYIYIYTYRCILCPFLNKEGQATTHLVLVTARGSGLCRKREWSLKVPGSQTCFCLTSGPRIVISYSVSRGGAPNTHPLS